MCPHCRAFITTSDSKCPYCGERVGPKAIELRNAGEMIAGLIPQARYVTTLLLIINGGLYLACSTFPGGATNPYVLYAFGAKLSQAVFQEHQWWRLITAGFLHGGLTHILMNGWVLLDLGAQVEIIYGPARLIVLYVLTSAAGFLLSCWWSPALSIGASAALFGFIGAMIALGVRHRNPMGDAIRGMYVRWALYTLVLGFLISRIDNAAHIGGLAAGFCVAYVAETPRVTGSGETLWRVAAWSCILITLVCFLKMWLWYSQIPNIMDL